MQPDLLPSDTPELQPDPVRHPRVKLRPDMPPEKILQRKLLDLSGISMSEASEMIGGDPTAVSRYLAAPNGGSPRRFAKDRALRWAEVLDVPVEALDRPSDLLQIYRRRIGAGGSGAQDDGAVVIRGMAHVKVRAEQQERPIATILDPLISAMEEGQFVYEQDGVMFITRATPVNALRTGDKFIIRRHKEPDRVTWVQVSGPGKIKVGNNVVDNPIKTNVSRVVGIVYP